MDPDCVSVQIDNSTTSANRHPKPMLVVRSDIDSTLWAKAKSTASEHAQWQWAQPLLRFRDTSVFHVPSPFAYVFFLNTGLPRPKLTLQFKVVKLCETSQFSSVQLSYHEKGTPKAGLTEESWHNIKI